MKGEREKRALLLWPLRRVLMAVAMAYLSGIFLSVRLVISKNIMMVLCALLLGLAALRLARKKGAVLCFCAMALLAGNQMAGRELMLREMPTGMYAEIEGRVASIEKEHRVALRDVVIDGERRLMRQVVVSLLPPKNEEKPIADTPAIGQRVIGTGRLFAPDEPRNPGAINGRYRALARGYELSGYLQDGWMAEGKPVFSFNACFYRIRRRIAWHVEQLFGERAALFLGVMLGDRDALDEEITHALQMTGTAHILTVSGLHLSMIAIAVGWLLERMALGRRCRFVILSAFLLAFTGLTGGAAGTVRAMIMAMLREYARVRGRRYEPLTALSFAALIMLLFKPVWVLDASFQFSFFVVLGITLLSGGIAEIRNRRRQTLNRTKSLMRMLLSMAGISLCAQVAALPMQLLLYGYVPLLALPMNMLCGFLMPYVMLGGWGCVFLHMISPALGGIAARLAQIPAVLFEAAGLYAVSFSHAIVRLPAPYPISIVLFACLMMILSRRIRFGRLRGAAAAALAAAVALTYLLRFDPRPRYVQLDVGQGDAALIRQGRDAMLIDTGPPDSYDLLRYLRHEGLNAEVVMLSHLDEDHVGALGQLTDSEIHISNIVLPVGALDGKAEEELVQMLSEVKGAEIYEAKRGDLLRIGDLSMLVLAPDGEKADRNEQSLVLYARIEGTTILLTGDLPSDSEPDVLPKCDVLKVAHHGSGDSTSRALLEQVRPAYAIVSVGAGNQYGHPNREVLERIKDVGAEILRTDRDGCITLWLDGGRIESETF